MLDRPYVVLDFETTGLGTDDRVIEIAAIRIDGARVTEFHALGHPGRALPAFITELTGISEADLAGAPPTTRAILELRAELLYDEPILVAHNVAFDRRFLDQELALAGLPPYGGPDLCTMKLSRKLFPRLPNHKLATLLTHWQIPIGRHHRALDDVRATAQLLHLLLQAAEEAGVDPLSRKRTAG
jgi:DNA polymerase III epsilon subunit family exonuclease